MIYRDSLHYSVGKEGISQDWNLLNAFLTNATQHTYRGLSFGCSKLSSTQMIIPGANKVRVILHTVLSSIEMEENSV